MSLKIVAGAQYWHAAQNISPTVVENLSLKVFYKVKFNEMLIRQRVLRPTVNVVNNVSVSYNTVCAANLCKNTRNRMDNKNYTNMFTVPARTK